MNVLIIDFKHADVTRPRPWPVVIDDDNQVISGLGPDDGATFVGFARKGEQRYYASVRDIGTIDFQSQDIVPVFVHHDVMFNWDIPIREIRAVDRPNLGQRGA
jgi:hypothetical protein